AGIDEQVPGIDPSLMTRLGTSVLLQPRPLPLFRPSRAVARAQVIRWLGELRLKAGGPTRETAPGRVATGCPGPGRACPRDRPSRGGGVPRRSYRRGSARRRAAGWRELPIGRRAAPSPPGTRRDVAPASH